MTLICVKAQFSCCGESAFVRNCRGIGQMGVMCRVGIVDYSGCGRCEGGRGTQVKGRGR
jgi:hypothetical protein